MVLFLCAGNGPVPFLCGLHQHCTLKSGLRPVTVIPLLILGLSVVDLYNFVFSNRYLI